MSRICAIVADLFMFGSRWLRFIRKFDVVERETSNRGTFSVQFIPTEPLKVDFISPVSDGDAYGLVLQGKAVVSHDGVPDSNDRLPSSVETVILLVDCGVFEGSEEDLKDVQKSTIEKVQDCTHIRAERAVWVSHFERLGRGRRMVLAPGFYAYDHDIDFGWNRDSLVDLIADPSQVDYSLLLLNQE